MLLNVCRPKVFMSGNLAVNEHVQGNSSFSEAALGPAFTYRASCAWLVAGRIGLLGWCPSDVHGLGRARRAKRFYRQHRADRSRARHGHQRVAETYLDRGKLAIKSHLITDRQSVPLIFCITRASDHSAREQINDR